MKNLFNLDRESAMLSEKEGDAVEQALTEIDLRDAVTYAKKLMGPIQFATEITSLISDKEYLTDVIRQMKENLDRR